MKLSKTQRDALEAIGRGEVRSYHRIGDADEFRDGPVGGRPFGRSTVYALQARGLITVPARQLGRFESRPVQLTDLGRQVLADD